MNTQSCLTCEHWLRDANDPYIGICAKLKCKGCSNRNAYRFQYDLCERWSFGGERIASREKVKHAMLEVANETN